MGGEAPQCQGMRGLIEAICQARDEADPHRLLDLFTQQAEPCLFGIAGETLDRGAGEIAERHAFDAVSPARVRLTPLEVESQESGRHGWAIGLLAARAEFEGGAHEFQVRFSGVAERENGRWRWRNLHFSVAPSVAVELTA